MKNVGVVIGWKLGHPQGLATFEDARSAELGGEDPESLTELGGMLIKAPQGISLPDEETLYQWEVEYDAAQELATKKTAALKAIEAQNREAELAFAVTDAGAPQAVKDYAAALQSAK